MAHDNDLTYIIAKLDAAFANLPTSNTPETVEAIEYLKTFCAISVRVMRSVNPSKLRGAARVEEIKARMRGRSAFTED